MESFEFAQWGVIAFLVWRVLALEASQLTKDDLKPIHKGLGEMLRLQQEAKGRW